MTEDLETKARGFKWYDILGTAVVAAAASGFIAGATCYRNGHDGGYNEGISEGYKAGIEEGKDAGYETGKIEGFAEGLAAGRTACIAEANESKPWAYGWVKEGSMFASFQRNVEGLGLVTYSIALNSAMIGTGEAVRIDAPDGISMSYADNLPHDGLVDLITTVDKKGNPVSFLFRETDYDAYQQMFQTADQSLKEIKAIFENKQ